MSFHQQWAQHYYCTEYAHNIYGVYIILLYECFMVQYGVLLRYVCIVLLTLGNYNSECGVYRLQPRTGLASDNGPCNVDYLSPYWLAVQGYLPFT
jgi:hypothetical protein